MGRWILDVLRLACPLGCAKMCKGVGFWMMGFVLELAVPLGCARMCECTGCGVLEIGEWMLGCAEIGCPTGLCQDVRAHK
eukprot:scaffold141682_cov19-Tisochrysis_lutea.AAC.4